MPVPIQTSKNFKSINLNSMNLTKKREKVYAKCKKHGRVLHYKDNGSGRLRCVICERQNKKHRRLNLKKRAVAYKGGKCQKCGYDKSLRALEFHHNLKKNFNLSKMDRYSWDKVMKELDSCSLLCANCHREDHYEYL